MVMNSITATGFVPASMKVPISVTGRKGRVAVVRAYFTRHGVLPELIRDGEATYKVIGLCSACHGVILRKLDPITGEPEAVDERDATGKVRCSECRDAGIVMAGRVESQQGAVAERDMALDLLI